MLSNIAIIIDVRRVVPDENISGCTDGEIVNNTEKYLLVRKTECPICLETCLKGSCFRKITKCGHSFCIDCIDYWLKTNKSCPMCKCNID